MAGEFINKIMIRDFLFALFLRSDIHPKKSLGEMKTFFDRNADQMSPDALEYLMEKICSLENEIKIADEEKEQNADSGNQNSGQKRSSAPR